VLIHKLIVDKAIRGSGIYQCGDVLVGLYVVFICLVVGWRCRNNGGNGGGGKKRRNGSRNISNYRRSRRKRVYNAIYNGDYKIRSFSIERRK